jgi:ketosteroid isomerase-like protein
VVGATSVEEFGDFFAAAYRTRDADAVADTYEDNAIFAMSDAGYPVAISRAAIVERTREIFAVTSAIEWTSDEQALSKPDEIMVRTASAFTDSRQATIRIGHERE